jgi:hypothetical protein
MARVKIEGIVDHFSAQMRHALDEAVSKAVPGARFRSHELFLEFRRAVGRRCNTWEEIPSRLVEPD